ncbi:hypothetical protein Pint_00555 [Pistacia integerrima]|uniref:Uncharacterized protein n=1 Tax=Pistacia integerrima TaxID=434235 RepID=A0ACC0ZNG6_9ROSI|nr:hypothetical protein Pint_00555 [Pistacia integerrima]
MIVHFNSPITRLLTFNLITEATCLRYIIHDTNVKWEFLPALLFTCSIWFVA